MKPLKALILTILSINVLIAQDTLFTTPFPYIHRGQQESIEFTATEPNTQIRFIHPIYNDAFWNKEKLANFIINEYNLSNSSTDFDIISSVAHFVKTTRLQDNFEIVQNTTPEAGNALSTVDHYSIQCGNYADKVYNLSNVVTDELGISNIPQRRVSLAAHQVMEYYDSNLSKWIFMDPDPGNGVFIPRDNGNLVSYSDIQANISILLDTTTSTFNTLSTNDSVSRIIYYYFLSSMLNTVTYGSPNEYIDNRDMFYLLPQGSKIKFEITNNKIYLNTHTATAQQPDALNACMASFGSGVPALIGDCFINLGALNGYDSSIVKDKYPNWDMKISATADSNSLFIKDSEHFFSVTLQPGTYSTSDINIPNLLKSIEPENPGQPFTVNGTTYNDTSIVDIYDNPTMNSTPINPSIIQYGLGEVIIPASVGSVTFTFYFNHQLFRFWDQSQKVLIENGNIESSQSPVNTTGINQTNELTVSAFPNPTADIINLSVPAQSVTLISGTGVILSQYSNTTQIDMTQFPSGVYYLQINHEGNQKTIKAVRI